MHDSPNLEKKNNYLTWNIFAKFVIERTINAIYK